MSLTTQPRASAVVIGNFDGVHRGHQSVLAALGRIANERNLTPTLLTFDPHPAVTLGRTAPALLTRLQRKIELVRRFCPGIVIAVRQFTRAFSEQTPGEFVERVLLGELDAKAVMVGANFRFGRARAGGLDELNSFGRALGFDLLAEVLIDDEHGALSSTRVRKLIASGDIDGANQLLGRLHMVSARVEHGHKRGRTIGFPTCNLAGTDELLPADGVYAVLVDRITNGVARAIGQGVANLGVRPTIQGDGQRLLEVHLFNFEEELYGEELRVHFAERLRDEQRFTSLDELKAQIARDSERARQTLATRTPPPDGDGAWG